MKILLHVGAYKTATTSIQTFFTNNSQEIAERFGILYPKAGTRPNEGSTGTKNSDNFSVAHHSLAKHIANNVMPSNDRLEQITNEILIESKLTNAETIFLSTELLSFCPIEKKERLLDTLNPESIEIIYCTRNPVDFIESMNNQSLKMGRLRRQLDKPIGFMQNIAEWGQLVGGSNVHVLAFSGRRTDIFLENLMSIIGRKEFAHFACPQIPKSNTSISHQGARLREALRPLIPTEKRISSRTRRKIAQAFADLENTRKLKTKLVTLTKEERELVQAVNSLEVESIVNLLVDPEDAEELFASRKQTGMNTRQIGMNHANWMTERFIKY